MDKRATGEVADEYQAIVVGGGIAGLTATAYLARAGLKPLLLEKESALGGLVRTFERRGIFYDSGIRSLENCGVLLPMIRDLGLDLPLVESPVSIGVEDRSIAVRASGSLEAYRGLLEGLYPDNRDDIAAIVAEIRRVMGYMDVIYGIDNPLFRDLASDPAYLARVILPWMVKYALAVPRISALNDPIESRLRRMTRNQSLIDLIAQHFFRDTPAFFALSYFSLYQDYFYPVGGTGALPEGLAAFARAHGATIATDTQIVAVDPERHAVTDASGRAYRYGALTWAADLKALYRAIDADDIESEGVRAAVERRTAAMAGKRGGDSVYMLFLGLDLAPAYLSERMCAHHFYTPSRQGQSQAGPLPLGQSREEILAWLDRFLRLTTYEISCPALRDPALAPPGKSGLIVSLLFDYDLTCEIADAGWYGEFKDSVDRTILRVLEESLFPGISDAVLDRFSSTPLTLARLTGNTDGAITGWAFTGGPIPAEHRMMAIARSVRTPLPDVYQAGQWTYSPSGLPISIITGKLAADAAGKAARQEA